MYRFLLMIVLALSLAACGGSSEESDDATTNNDDTTASTDTTTANDAEEEPENDRGYVLTVSGAEDFEFDETVTFSCIEDMMAITTFAQSPKLDIYLPSSVQPGTYALADFDSSADPSYVEGAAVVAFSGNFVPGSGSGYGDFYFQNSSGELEITEVPAAVGERFVAELNATLEDSDGDVVTLTGSFDLETDGFSSMDCEYGS